MDQSLAKSQRNVNDPMENCFTVNGNHHFEDEAGNFRIAPQFDARGNQTDFRSFRQAYAIEKVMPSIVKYFVKRNDSGALLDPRDTDHMVTLSRVRNGNPVWTWTDISKSGFEFYLDYLKRNNKVFYAKAKTELANPGG